MKKLGPNAVPFTFHLPQNAPSSVTLQPGETDQGAPCGVEYILKLFVGDSELDRSHKRCVQRRVLVGIGVLTVQKP